MVQEDQAKFSMGLVEFGCYLILIKFQFLESLVDGRRLRGWERKS